MQIAINTFVSWSNSWQLDIGESFDYRPPPPNTDPLSYLSNKKIIYT